MNTMFKKGLGIAAVAAGLAFGGAASADPIQVQFNIAAFGDFTCNNADVELATVCNTGAPNVVAFVQSSNIGLASGSSVSFNPNDIPLVVGLSFQKIFTTAAGTFTENLTVTSVVAGNNVLGMQASGTIACSGGPCLTAGGQPLEETAVFFSVAYTQNEGPGTQINGSFNNSTTPFRTPEPGTLALMGLALAAVGFVRRRKQS